MFQKTLYVMFSNVKSPYFWHSGRVTILCIGQIMPLSHSWGIVGDLVDYIVVIVRIVKINISVLSSGIKFWQTSTWPVILLTWGDEKYTRIGKIKVKWSNYVGHSGIFRRILLKLIKTERIMVKWEELNHDRVQWRFSVKQQWAFEFHNR